MSPLRQSMVNAMTVRGLSERTIECYTESISRLSSHYQGTNPARLIPQQVEAYLLPRIVYVAVMLKSSFAT